MEGKLDLALSEEARPGAARKLSGKEAALLVATACSCLQGGVVQSVGKLAQAAAGGGHQASLLQHAPADIAAGAGRRSTCRQNENTSPGRMTVLSSARAARRRFCTLPSWFPCSAG